MDDEDFSGIMEGLSQVLSHVRGEDSQVRIVRGPDVKAIRKKTGLSQAKFAYTYGLDKRAVEQWEQARRAPDRAAVTLYRMIDRDPEKVKELIGNDNNIVRETA